STPSSLFRFFSMRAAHEAQVIPSRSSRTSCRGPRAIPSLMAEHHTPRGYSTHAGVNADAPGCRGEALALRAFGRRRLHGRARDRERPCLRLRLALLVLRGLRRRFSRRCLIDEDRFLRLPGEQALELVLVDRLPVDQDPGDPM